MVGLIVGFENVTCMCLASLMYHHVWLNDAWITNHVVLSSSHLQRSELLQSKCDSCILMYPWNDLTHVFSGIG
jgi:hypothetical protein